MKIPDDLNGLATYLELKGCVITAEENVPDLEFKGIKINERWFVYSAGGWWHLHDMQPPDSMGMFTRPKTPENCRAWDLVDSCLGGKTTATQISIDDPDSMDQVARIVKC